MWDTHRVVPFIVPNQQERKHALGSLAGQKWRLKKTLSAIIPFFSKIKQPTPQDWLGQFQQDGQTFQVYKSIYKNYIQKKIQTIFIGLYQASISKQDFTILKNRAKAFFHGCLVKKLIIPKIDKSKFQQIVSDKGEKFYNGQLLNKYFTSKLPKNTFSLIVLTDLNIYNPKNFQLMKFQNQKEKNDWMIEQNWVYGLASLKDRTGVVSVGKIDKAIEQKDKNVDRIHFLQKVINHQVSHTFGIKHCIYYQCLMNGSNNFEQASRKFFQMCPVCIRKLQHNIEFDMLQRYTRLGANAMSAIASIRSRLNLPCAAVQIAVGADQQFKGCIDLIKMKAYYFQGKNGENIVQQSIPNKYSQQATKMRAQLISNLANIDEEIQALFLQQKEPSIQQIKKAIRNNCINLKFFPIFIGSAYKNKGVQLALDGVCQYLPNPSQKLNYGYKRNPSTNQQQKIVFSFDPKKQFIGYVFKLQQNKFGQLTFIRVYQGKLKKGQVIYIHKKKIRVSRMVKLHANQMEDISQVQVGDIFAIFGADCTTGQTMTQNSSTYIQCSSMFIPQPVISLNINTTKSEYNLKFQKAIGKFQRQDPTFHVNVDKQSQEIIISGMGQLHLDIYVQRMKRQFNIDVKTGAPTVNYRETITQKTHFNYLHKKQSGGAGQYAKIIGYVQPISSKQGHYENQFVNKVVGTAIPPQFIGAIQKAFKQLVKKGPLTGYPVVNFRYVVQDGATHIVDSSSNAFAIATKYSFLQALKKAQPLILEPIMQVQVNVPTSMYQSVMAGLNKRKGLMTNTQTKGQLFTMTCDVPLRQMFGYSSQLRGLTSGQGEFSMEYKKHSGMSPLDAKVAMQQYQKKKKEKN